MTTTDTLFPSDAMIAENSGGIDRLAYVRMGAEVVNQAIIQHAGLQPNQRFLDVGCGCAKIARPRGTTPIAMREDLKAEAEENYFVYLRSGH